VNERLLSAHRNPLSKQILTSKSPHKIRAIKSLARAEAKTVERSVCPFLSLEPSPVLCEHLLPKRVAIPQESVYIGCRPMRTWLKAIGKRRLSCTMMDGCVNDSADRPSMVLGLAALHRRQNVNTNQGPYVTEASLAPLELASPSI
jgi:hypothetical protein